MGSLIYMTISLICCFDKRGKEVYFEDSNQEYSLSEGILNIESHNGKQIKTDDWGYIYRAYESPTRDPAIHWEDYSILKYIIATSIISGVFWLGGGVFDLIKFIFARRGVGYQVNDTLYVSGDYS